MDVDAEERYSDVILRLAKVLGHLLFSALDRRKCLTSAARLATERRGCVRAAAPPTPGAWNAALPQPIEVRPLRFLRPPPNSFAAML